VLAVIRKRRNLGVPPLGVPSSRRIPVERVNPTDLATAGGTSKEIGRARGPRGGDRNRTLMRHAGPALTSPVVLLAAAMIYPACIRGLVPAAGLPELLLPHSAPTGLAAIPLAPVAAGADCKHRVATRITTPARARTVGGTIRRHSVANSPQYSTDDRAFGARMILLELRTSGQRLRKLRFSDDRQQRFGIPSRWHARRRECGDVRPSTCRVSPTFA
jgi:hypothetical protein